MSLETEIENYKRKKLPNLNEIKAFYEGMTFLDAIQNASIGKTPDGKMDQHQWRVGYKNGGAGAKELIKKKIELQECKSFEDIFTLTEIVKNEIWRLGDLWSYDTALRIGFNLKLYPKEVYIQAGVVKGARKAFGIRYSNIRGKRSIPLFEFNEEFSVLKPYELENFLCIWGKKT